jgi:glycosyltransferase involved in cell wall biosynthesis
MNKSRSKRRIVFFLQSLEIGGAQTHACMLAEYLGRSGEFEVQVWTFAPQGLIGEVLRDKGIKIVQVPEIRSGIIQKTLGLARLILMLRKAKPTIILPFCDYPNKLCGALWEFTGAKACIWNQMDEGREITNKFLEKRSLKRSSIFVANSEEGRSFLKTSFKIQDKKIRIIHNGIHLEKAGMDRAGWRKHLGVSENAFLAVMVANFTKFKDHPTLLKAWSIVLQRSAKKDPPLLLLVGNLRLTESTLRTLALDLGLGDSVIFSGQVKDLNGLLLASDLGVFSSKREGMPYAVLDYMLAKVPIVATGITGIREALGPDYPYLVPADDPEKFAEKVLELIANPGSGKKWIEKNYQRVTSLFSPQIMGENYEKLFDELLDGGFPSIP